MLNQTKHLNYERRKQKAIHRLGKVNPSCIVCGETDWRCLELHHVGQEAFDTSTVIHCRNCHRKASDAQEDHPKPLQSDTHIPYECIGHWLLGLADFFELLIEKLREFGHLLIKIAKQSYSALQHMPTMAKED